MADRFGTAPGRSPKKVAEMLDRRVCRASRSERACSRTSSSMRCAASTCRCPSRSTRRRRRAGAVGSITAIPTWCSALEAKGYEYHGQRERFDDDALRGNELLLAGFRVLTFTSAFTDCRSRGRSPLRSDTPSPGRSARISFAEWKRLR